MADKDVLIRQILKRLEQVEQDKILLQRQNELVIAENLALKEENLQLQERIARLEKNSSTSSKPPSSDITNPSEEPNSKKNNRKRGGQKGHKKHTRKKFTQEEIDEEFVHELSEEEVKRRGLIKLPQTESALQQVSLPDKLFYVTDHLIQLYMDKNGDIVKATLPPEIRKCGLFAPDMMALTAYFKGRCHCSYSTVEDIFKEVFGLEVSAGFLTKVCVSKVSKSLAHAYEEVKAFIREQPVVGSDETGHKNPAFKSAWTWCWQTPEAALFYNTNSRGSNVLKDVLGEDFSGVIVCDYFSANKKFISDLGLTAQFCFAHLIRDMKFLTTLPYKSVVGWAEKLLEILRKIFQKWKLLHCFDFERYKKLTAKLKKEFLQKVRRPPNYSDAKNIRDRFDKIGAERYFLFLERDDVQPTNNGTEQTIRFVVIDRKVTLGTRSNAGMRFCERMWTIIATCKRQGQSVFEFLKSSVNATFTGTQYPQLIS